MARKKKPPEHENHERWLVSYADFITLLFAFFVVMFASSRSDKGKASLMAESVRRALDEGHVAAAISGVLGGTPRKNGKGNLESATAPKSVNATTREGTLAELLPSLNVLSVELKREIELGQMDVQLKPRGLVITLRQAAFFPSGEDTIEPNTFGSIEKVAAAIKKLPNPVRLEGHTDAQPIHTSRYRSNWDLSTARSIAMLELFTKQFGVPENRLAVAGYADTFPVDSNETDEGRRHNRRVEIVVLNQAGLQTEPQHDPPPP
ncbi:MAG: OmpA family protein [Acidobacteria bacterium]|nr:OmpA family protein [Acidobacteriota bacterium]